MIVNISWVVSKGAQPSNPLIVSKSLPLHHLGEKQPSPLETGAWLHDPVWITWICAKNHGLQQVIQRSWLIRKWRRQPSGSGGSRARDSVQQPQWHSLGTRLSPCCDHGCGYSCPPPHVSAHPFTCISSLHVVIYLLSFQEFLSSPAQVSQNQLLLLAIKSPDSFSK